MVQLDRLTNNGGIACLLSSFIMPAMNRYWKLDARKLEEDRLELKERQPGACTMPCLMVHYVREVLEEVEVEYLKLGRKDRGRSKSVMSLIKNAQYP